MSIEHSLPKMPLIKAIIPLLLGIIIAHYFNLPTYLSVASLIILFGLLILTYKYKLKPLFSLSLFMFFLFSGIQLTDLNDETKHKNYFANHLNQCDYLSIEINKPVIEKDNSFEIIGEVIAVKTDSGFTTTSGKVRLYFSKKIKYFNIEYGSKVIVKNTLKPITAPKNPGQFNFKNYSAKKQIYYQGFVGPGQFYQLYPNSINYLTRLHNLRNKLIKQFKTHINDTETFALVSSLLLGDRTYLNPELKASFIDAGIMHILAVSGLHVGILLLIILYCLKPLPNTFKWRLIKTLFAIILIGTYAIITGLSPSIQRAAILFSFIALGQLYTRSTNLYNLLAASAITLILINPFVIFEVGFQLSYAAVLGIITFQPKLEQLLPISNKPLRFFWQIVTVSFAAQLATLPFSLYYFHQIPTYFLISNLVAIPAAILILTGGIALLCFSWFDIVANAIGYGLEIVVYLLSTCVNWFNSLPYAVISEIDITAIEVILLYIIIGLAGLIIYFNNRWLAYTAIGACTILITLQTIETIQHSNQKQMVVYAINKYSAIDFISGTENYLLHSFETFDSKQARHYIYPNWWANNITTHHNLNLCPTLQTKHLYRKNNFIQFYNKTILIIDNPLPKPNTAFKKLTVDYLIITNNPKIDITKLSRHFNFKLVIIDGSNHYKRRQKWREQAELNSINLYDVIEKSALIISN